MTARNDGREEFDVILQELKTVLLETLEILRGSTK
jgi:hypothetical protein